MEILQVIITAVSLGSFYALAALGIGLLFGVLRLINFAHGDFITVGAFALIVPSAAPVATMLIGDFHFVPLIISVILVVVTLALVSYFLVFRPLENAPPATFMVASFAVGIFLQNVLLMIFGGRPKAAGLWSDLNMAIEISENVSVPQLQLIIIGVTLILLVLLTLFLRYTPIGVQMRAAAEDFRMARMLGVRANLVIAVAFVLSGALAGVMSLLLVTQTGVLSFRMGIPIMLFAFIATVIGGMGNLTGAVVGGYTVGIVSVVLQAILPEEMRGFRDAFVFGLVIVILVARPQGLVPSKAMRERI